MNNSSFQFTFSNIRDQFQYATRSGYDFITCEEFYHMKKAGLPLDKRIIVNRVDIDLSVRKAEKLADIFNELKIKASFFVRLHAPEYNPFSFDNYRILKKIIDSGHELGYHSEVVDESVIWNEDAVSCLRRDIDVINSIFNIRISGVASHGGMTGLNNLDFWKDRKALDFGLFYEAYDSSPEFNLFNTSFYISDSEWTRWKCYDKGVLIKDDRRSFAEHLKDQHNLIYLLIHSDTYFERHFYENW